MLHGEVTSMQPNALDYRSHYGNPYHNPYNQNPLSMGQWVMIGAGALAVGGLGYWIYAKMKTNGNGAAANGANGNGNGAEGNPYNWHRAA